ncbi:hypothetical protein IAD21_05617 [Abditibacteriota bacterium]|nr:hypothetical protein IAD21_05617 [Abditibacteriota bacterium]
MLEFEDEVLRMKCGFPAWRLLTCVHGHSEGLCALRHTTSPKEDTEPKALACYGLLLANNGEMKLRFVHGVLLRR